MEKGACIRKRVTYADDRHATQDWHRDAHLHTRQQSVRHNVIYDQSLDTQLMAMVMKIKVMKTCMVVTVETENIATMGWENVKC
jgi:hypothetical protein